MELVNNHYRTKVTDPKLFSDYVESIRNKVFIANVYNQWTSKEDSLIHHVFDVIDYAVKQYGVKFILLDHLRLFLNIAQDRERTEIDNFLQKCVRLAIRDNVHIWLIVQPRKLPPGQRKISMDDLKGSGNIAQDAHNVVLIHRNTGDKNKAGFVEIEVAKNRKFGTMIGTKPLLFDTKSMSNYYEIGDKK
jgi:hypothetical protein